MEITISPHPHLIGVILTLSNLIYFTKKVTKELYTNTFIHQDKNIRRQKIIIMFLLYITLLVLLGYNILGSFVGYKKLKIIFRSIMANDITRTLNSLEIIYETLLKSSMFLTLAIFIPFIYGKKQKEKKDFLIFYSGIRLPLYPVTYHLLRDYSYFSMFLIEIFQLGEAALLEFLFLITSLNKKVVEKYNLIETYEYEYIYLKIIRKCKIIVLEFLLEMVYRSFLIYLMVSNIGNIQMWMNRLYLLKLVYLQMMVLSIISVIFCKEQETFDNLMNFTEVKKELKSLSNK